MSSQAGLDKPEPSRPLRESRSVMALGVAAMVIYALRRLTDHSRFHIIAMYSPFFGAIFELISMYVFWTALLEAKRRSRPLRAEPLLFIGFGLVLLPPAFELIVYSLPWLS